MWRGEAAVFDEGFCLWSAARQEQPRWHESRRASDPAEAAQEQEGVPGADHNVRALSQRLQLTHERNMCR